jgi:hypothetical protein
MIYLQPGLTGAQRAAAVRRLRQEARMGCGPSLPCARLALACAADWIRCGARQLAAIVRLHPVGTLLPVLLLTAMAVPAPAGHVRGGESTVTCAALPELAARMLVPSDDTLQCGSVPALPGLGSAVRLAPSR